MIADFGLSKGGIVKKLNAGNTVAPFRIFLEDNTFRTIVVSTITTVNDVLNIMSKKVIILSYSFLLSSYF